MKPSIFVVEDDPDISRLVRHHLEADGFAVKVFSTGNTVIADSERQRPTLFILDIMVPGKDGLELCRQIRQIPALAATPVIFLTAKSGEADRILGLELGADDYIPKPFSPRELVARVKAVLRRFERPLSQAPVKIGEIEIDPSAMTLTVSGNLVTTTATEFRLLDYFARHIGRVFTRDQLLDSVWRDTAYVTPRSVDVYVRRIREKIEPDPENPAISKRCEAPVTASRLRSEESDFFETDGRLHHGDRGCHTDFPYVRRTEYGQVFWLASSGARILCHGRVLHRSAPAAYREFAGRVAAGDFDARLDEDSADEIGQVSASLDETASHLEDSFAALQTSQRQLETLLNSMQDAVIAIGADDRVQWANQAMDELVPTERARMHCLSRPSAILISWRPCWRK